MRGKIIIKKRVIKIVLIAIAPFVIFYTLYIDRIYPGVYVAGTYVGGMSVNDATKVLNENVKTVDKIVLTSEIVEPTKDNQKFEIPTSTLNLSYDIPKTINKSLRLGRSGNVLFDLAEIIGAKIKGKQHGYDINLDEDKLSDFLATVAGQATVDPIHPSVQLQKGKVVINKGKIGSDLDIQKTRTDIGHNLSFQEDKTINLNLLTIDPTLNDLETQDLEKRANTLIVKTFVVEFENKTLEIKNENILKLINPKGGYEEKEIVALVDEIRKLIERDPQNAKFTFEGGKVKEFIAAKDGIKIVSDKLKENVLVSINKLESEDIKSVNIELPIEKASPTIKTSEVNDLGIKELIGFGKSKFEGSIPSRIYNVNLAATRINGTLIAPGETFSFVNAVGDISALTGYKQAYIIQGGKTVLGDGGGVCQVSTTLFRAALNSGLPILERNAHAYRVHYYEEDALPGLDATVYSPTVDLKFKNDTQNHILIQVKTDTKNLTMEFELYGTKDSRVVTLTKPIVTDITSAPAPLYTDDPSLRAGIVKQIDFAAGGAKSRFDYKVEKDGQTTFQKTFFSNYRPWQAKFLRGTGV